MQHFPMRWARNPLRFLAALSIACFALVDTACSKRKDGVIVEVSDELAQSGAAIRDWRRSGMGVLDVQVFTEIPIPGNAWTLAAYDKEGKLLTSGRISGPRARERDTVWIRLATPYRDLFDKADRVVVGADLSVPAYPSSS
ncbi:MAG TPA: hypothetical protein VKE94_10530 [Gemmataceae bacterium]|jgi:hypothetical protein|nr:hypothetical protein [Gemmataceae bacterium]